MSNRMCGWILAASLIACAGVTQAAVRVKANTATDLNLSASWVGGAVPGASDMAQWDSTVTGANAVQLGGNLSFRGLTVVNPGGPVTISGAHTLTLGGEGVIMRAGSADLTFSNAELTMLIYAGQ